MTALQFFTMKDPYHWLSTNKDVWNQIRTALDDEHLRESQYMPHKGQPDSMPDFVWEVVLDCCERPGERPSAKDICERVARPRL